MTSGRRYFAILGAMRTGSNLLEKTLEALGDTVCYGEAFNPGFVSGPRKHAVLGYDLTRRKADPFGFFDMILKSEPDRIPGFRMFRGHDKTILNHILRDPSCVRIILSRDPLDSYVSLKIAQRTDQWLLRNPRRRASARIRFDAGEFAEFQRKRSAHYDWLETTLQANGMDAIRITYQDLFDHAKLQQIAREIGSCGTVPGQAPTLRQNPEPLAQKVENYAEMCATLGLTPQDASETQTHSPTHLLQPPDFPVAYAPIAGCAFAPMVTLLHRIEVRDFGRPKLTPVEMLDRAMRGVLYPCVETATSSEKPLAFCMISDPFTRLHAAFVDELFGPARRFSPLRRALIKAHGGVPPPKGLAAGKAEYPADLHQVHFAGFLKAVAEAFQGEGPYPLIDNWTSQATLLDRHRERVQITRIFHHQAFDEAVHWMTDQMGLPRFPPGQINGMRQAERQTLVPIEEVRIPKLSDLVRELYADDYARFGIEQQPQSGMRST